jgi:hypothetical protein
MLKEAVEAYKTEKPVLTGRGFGRNTEGRRVLGGFELRLTKALANSIQAVTRCQ